MRRVKKESHEQQNEAKKGGGGYEKQDVLTRLSVRANASAFSRFGALLAVFSFLLMAL